MWDGGRLLERWADAGALASFERAYAHYDLRDAARALWETIDLFQGLEEETARRLGLELDARPRRATATPRRGRPRPAARGYSLAVKRAAAARSSRPGCSSRGCGDDSPPRRRRPQADTMSGARLLPSRRQGLARASGDRDPRSLEPLALRAAGTRPDRRRSAAPRLHVRGAGRRHETSSDCALAQIDYTLTQFSNGTIDAG